MVWEFGARLPDPHLQRHGSVEVLSIPRVANAPSGVVGMAENALPTASAVEGATTCYNDFFWGGRCLVAGAWRWV